MRNKLNALFNFELNQDDWWLDVYCTEYWCKDDHVGTYHRTAREQIGQDMINHLLTLHTLSDAQVVVRGPVDLTKYDPNDVPF